MKAVVINLDERPDRMEQFKKNKFPFEVERYSAQHGYCGEDGCTYSHLAVISSQLFSKGPFVVFEDDCVLLESWDVVEKAMNQLPNDWDALWLGANLRRPLTKYSENLYRLTDAYGLHAVIYNSRKMVEYILDNHHTPSGKNLDIFYRKEVLKRFNCFITYPIVATQLSDQGNIAPVNYDNYNVIINNYNKYV